MYQRIEKVNGEWLLFTSPNDKGRPCPPTLLSQHLQYKLSTALKELQELEKELGLSNVRLSLFEKAAKKQKNALEQGGWGHAIWCNYQRENGDGRGRCNCGVCDLQTAMNSEA